MLIHRHTPRRKRFVDQLSRFNLQVPDWVTEAGDPQEGPNGILTPQGRRHQAEFISRAFPQSLAAGVARHFWFVFPFYREGKRGWGLFEPDQRAPYPGLAALSAATYALGHGDLLGVLPLADKQTHALAFARGDGTAALAVWRESDEPLDVTLPLDGARIEEARTYLGTPLAVDNGPLKVHASRGATYVVVRQDVLDGKLQSAAAPAPAKPAERHASDQQHKLHSIVVRLRVPHATTDKAMDGYRVDGGSATLEAEIYNFGNTPLDGELLLSGPDAWKMTPARSNISVPSGERAIVPIQLTVPATKDPATLRLVARSDAGESAPAAVRLSVNLNSLKPRESLPLNLNKPEQWHKNIAGHGDMQVAAGPDGAVRFAFQFSEDGDNWAYPRVAFQPPRDMTAYDGLRFEYRTDTKDAGAVRALLFEPEGAGYISDSGLGGSTEWRSVTVLFSQLGYVSATGRDPNGKLDLDRIAGLSIGAHCKPRSVVLEVRNVELVKF